MNLDPLFHQKIALGNELNNAIKHILIGLRELQISFRETSYYSVAFQLLDVGIERLLKCAICYGYLKREDRFPKVTEIRTHNVSDLLSTFLNKFFSTSSIPALELDQTFLSQDSLLKAILESFSKFGSQARYYNLNVVTEAEEQSNIEDIWNKLQKDFIFSQPELVSMLSDAPDHKTLNEALSVHFISCFEKFTRAMVRQFTLGNLGKEPKRSCGTYSHFLCLTDDKIGTIDYCKYFIKETKSPKSIDGFKSEKYVRIQQSEFEGQWPFKNTDSVIVEKRDNDCLTIVINKKVYALNGMAIQVLGLPSPFEDDEAYIGRSLDHFFKVAENL